jgi:tRNA threonylcarbamoyladenosine biosynthesis protein TsaE
MPELMVSETYSLNDIASVAKKLLHAAGPERVWLFQGEPGAGKTTLIRSICEQLGVDVNTLSSPTFNIMNRYSGTAGMINHFDLYRIRKETELMDIGMDEQLDSGAYCFIEWPDRMDLLRPKNFFSVALQVQDDVTRTVVYTRI